MKKHNELQVDLRSLIKKAEKKADFYFREFLIYDLIIRRHKTVRVEELLRNTHPYIWFQVPYISVKAK